MVGVEVILTLVHSVFEDPSSDGNWNTESEPYEFLSRSGKWISKWRGHRTLKNIVGHYG